MSPFAAHQSLSFWGPAPRTVAHSWRRTLSSSKIEACRIRSGRPGRDPTPSKPASAAPTGFDGGTSCSSRQRRAARLQRLIARVCSGRAGGGKAAGVHLPAAVCRRSQRPAGAEVEADAEAGKDEKNRDTAAQEAT